jgi:hypothetical protein
MESACDLGVLWTPTVGTRGVRVDILAEEPLGLQMAERDAIKVAELA